MAWIALLFCVVFTNSNGQEASGNQFFNQQIKLLNEVRPEGETSCVITQSSRTHDLYLICPTEIDCYVKVYTKKSFTWFPPPFPLHLDAECKAIDDQEPPPVSKLQQLNAVLQVLRLPNENVCQFSGVENFNLVGSGLVNMELLGRANCWINNARNDNGRCSYKLKFLSLSWIKIESLSNQSFCQFRQLEYLMMINCSLQHVEANAFVDLVHLKEIYLRIHQLTTLPVNLFANNIHLQMVDLTSNHLQSQALHALATINSLRRLYLMRNQISFVDDQLTFPSTLIHLYIFANNLQKIRQEFSRLSNLTKLSLYNNSINEVDKDAFQHMRAVEYIDLVNNKIKRLHKDTFKNNLQLEKLFLNENELCYFPRVGHLTNLKELDLSSNYIRFISKTDLINCTQLSAVSLFDNKLSFIENGAFDNIRRLEYFDLGYNRLTQTTVNFKNLNVLILNLRFNNFTTFTFEIFPRNVTTLTLSNNQIELIEPHNFADQRGKEWSLTNLSLSHNRIRSIENLTLPPSIQTVELSDNQISQIFSLEDVNSQNLTELTSINVKNNNISVICESSFHNLGSNTSLSYYISGNPLKCSCENMWLPDLDSIFTSTKIADINDVTCFQMFPDSKFNTKTKIKSIGGLNFMCLSDHVHTDRCVCPPVVNMRWEGPCLTNCTCFTKFDLTVVYFVCNNRHLTRVPSGLKNNSVYDRATAVLFLNDNNISRVNANNFHNLPNKLIRLNLNNSNVRSIDGNAFDKLILLRTIHLNNNLLQVLPNGLFDKLTQLRDLYLSNNRLTHLADDTFSSLISLEGLYLHNNSLTNLSFDQITRLKALQSITLYDNPWSCDCTFIGSFKDFLVNSSNKVDNELPLSCIENGKEFNISNINMDHCFKPIDLVYLDHSAIWIPTMILGLVLVMTVKWRYELQVLIYSRFGLRMLHWKHPEEDEMKQFDAFVAYNSLDSKFLVEQLLPGLEGIDRPYRILIHDREHSQIPDFLAGGFIADNILEAVKISSRTIILLTENFVKSRWCRLEFKTAHVQMLKDRCPRLLVIAVGDVSETLGLEMQLYLKTNSYLKWGETLFWEKLYYAMPDQRVTTPPTDTIPMREL